MKEKVSIAENRIFINTPLPFDYLIRHPNDEIPQQAFLLLHGFMQSGKKIFESLMPVLPLNSIIIAPNGPFIIPQKKNQNYKLGYSWYFYNPIQEQYVVDMEPAVRFLSGAIGGFEWKILPLTIIGFSQGGYLAPFLGKKIHTTQQVIGIGCEFLADEIGTVKFRLDSIHGDRDEIIQIQDAWRNHKILNDRGILGEFHTLNGTKHQIDDEVKKLVYDLTKN